MKLLITHSLLSAWKWWIDFDGDDNDARKSFENTLNKIPFDNKYMQAGRDFEELIKRIAESPIEFNESLDNQYYTSAYKIAQIVKNSTWQVACKKDVVIENQPFMLYGRTDVLKGPDIFDIKFVKKYEIRKYFNSTQHKMYFECLPGTERFTYLASDGKEVFKEVYNRDETDSIIPIVYNWWSWVNQFPEYLEIYQEKWQAY